ncbi:hypothetical protein BOQ62_03035 [Chryseobacterium sp. CH21]|uniref:hypothetical protein n=1 Tax=Chryseobacterium sp. CH21 TaxID=713556 RepID=UPI00100B06D2|nr:hypothetical protein [Chryseobacterium sp. CH21]RXM41028.1 hypothetical protein BOQ62_03035 [Chryseobacterium sp. CH21]
MISKGDANPLQNRIPSIVTVYSVTTPTLSGKRIMYSSEEERLPVNIFIAGTVDNEIVWTKMIL